MKTFAFIDDVPTYVKTKHEGVSYLDEYLFVSIKCLRGIHGDIPSDICFKVFGWKPPSLKTYFSKFYEAGLLTRDSDVDVDLYIDSPTIASFKKKYGLKVYKNDHYIRAGVSFVQLYLNYRDTLDELKKAHGISTYEALYLRLKYKILSVKTRQY